MATIHVWNGGTNTSPYDTWAKAATILNTGLLAWATGDVVHVAKDHTEGTATITLSVVGNIAEPVPVYTVDRTTNAYAVATATTLNASTSGADISIFGGAPNLGGIAFHGLVFNANDNISANSDGYVRFYDCSFSTASSSANMSFGSVDSESFNCFDNCSFTETALNYFINVGSNLQFNGCTFSNTPTSSGLFRAANAARGKWLTCTGCDFSGLDSGSILVDFSTTSDSLFRVRMINCDVHNTVTISDDGQLQDGSYAELISTDSAGALYRYEKHHYRGTITTQTGDLYRTNGYSDADGNTSASHKIVPKSTLERATHIEGPMLTQYVSTTGAKTIEVHAADTFTTAPNKNQLYIEVFYLNAAGETLYTLGTTRDANILATTALTTTTGEWTDGGSALTHEYKMSGSFTVNQAGYIGVRVVLEGDQTAETANALYYDPKLEIS